MSSSDSVLSSPPYPVWLSVREPLQLQCRVTVQTLWPSSKKAASLQWQNTLKTFKISYNQNKLDLATQGRTSNGHYHYYVQPHLAFQNQAKLPPTSPLKLTYSPIYIAKLFFCTCYISRLTDFNISTGSQHICYQKQFFHIYRGHLTKSLSSIMAWHSFHSLNLWFKHCQIILSSNTLLNRNHKLKNVFHKYTSLHVLSVACCLYYMTLQSLRRWSYPE